MYGYTFNSIHTSVHGVVAKSRNRQVLPASNDIYQQIPGRNGSYLFAGELPDRMIVVEHSVLKTTFALLRSGLRGIAAWLYTTERKPLVFDDEPGMFYDAKVEGAIDFEQVRKSGKFTVVFRCSPLAYTAETYEQTVLDEEFEELFRFVVTANNTGTYETLPEFTFIFTSAATEIKVTLGTKYIRIVHAFAIADVLIVNCETGLISINGTRAMEELDWANSDFFPLPLGDNILTISPVNVCRMTITYNPKSL